MRNILFILILLTITLGHGPLQIHATNNDLFDDDSNLQGGTVIELTEDTVWSDPMSFTPPITIRGTRPDIRLYFDSIRFKAGVNGDVAIIENLTLIPTSGIQVIGNGINFVLRNATVRDRTSTSLVSLLDISAGSSWIIVENTVFTNNVTHDLITVFATSTSFTMRNSAIIGNHDLWTIFYVQGTGIDFTIENTTISGQTSKWLPIFDLAGDMNVTLRHVTIVEPAWQMIRGTPALTVKLEGSILVVSDCSGTEHGVYNYTNTLSNLPECPANGFIAPGVDIETTAADNRGGTFTNALIPYPANPAIDGNPNCELATDQRGLPRDTNCDIGAFELQVSEVPTDTPVPPTDTLVPPTDTSVPPTDTPMPPTDTSVPPTSSLDATAVCNGPNLEVTIVSGDAPFIINASAGVNMPVAGVGLGTTIVNGPEKWDNVTVTETSGEEIVNLGQFRCRTDERPVPLTPQHRSHIIDTMPTFSWTGITNANNYRVFVFDDSDPLGRTVDIRQNSGGLTMLTLSTPLPTGRLFWRVRGRQNRIWSLWSIRFTLFVDPVAPLSGQAPISTIDLNPQREEPVPPNNR